MWLKHLLTPSVRQGVACIGAHSNVSYALRRLFNASANADGSLVIVNEDNGSASMKFPSVWLRDNCHCNQCFDTQTMVRKPEANCTDIGIRATNIITDNKSITVNWSDEHNSTFDLGWLRERDFSPENRRNYTHKVCKPKLELWSKDEFEKIQQNFQFSDIINSDDGLYEWLDALAKRGFALIKNAPTDETVIRQIGERVGYIKRTTYGEIIEVKTKENTHTYAYRMTGLPLHTDLPYFEYKPGINMLHCYEQSLVKDGGASLMTDGFYVAEQLRKFYPEHYKVLVETPVDWYDIGNENGNTFHTVWRSPMINLDVDGNYHRINHNTTKRDSHFTVPLDQVISWYAAHNKFKELADEQRVQFKIMPGDVFTFNNLRMLHGRTAYIDSSQNKRRLIAGYVDWDLAFTRMRSLRYPNAYTI